MPSVYLRSMFNSLSALINQISVKDIVDIVVVTFLIYETLLIVHGTRAVQMLTGIGLLLALFWLGHSFDLYSLNWILSHFFDSFLIIVVILFQDQFRNALASFATGQSFFTFIKKHAGDQDINEIVEAYQLLSKKKTGALMVIERNQGLANFIETGSKINADIHSDLIFSIFQSVSPLHDGAIIVNKGKMVAAGCFLPLSRNYDVDRHLGTRHRAALGISEDTDAIAVTVSEETGRINIAIEGRFYHCSEARHLRKYLNHLLLGEALDHKLLPIASKAEAS